MNIEQKYDKEERIWRMNATNDQGERLGGLYYKKTSSELRLCYISVKEDGHGVGRALLEELVNTAQQDHATAITGAFIPVPETSGAAQHLYESLGFVINPKTKEMRKEL